MIFLFRNLLIYIAVIGTAFFLYWYIKSYSPETVNIILQIREWIIPYADIILRIFFMTFLVSIILVYFDKDFDEEQIKRRTKIRFVSIYFPSNSTIKTQPFADILYFLSITVILIVFFLLLAPDIFQVEAPSLREIYNNYKITKGDK